jgi:hypothetical protein
MAALSDRKCLSENSQIIRWLGILLKSGFFAMIKQNCGRSVEKYWLTGVLPVFRDGVSPLTATQLISFQERYQSLCGFTQADVDSIVMRALREFSENEQKSTLASLKRWYNGYMFSPASSNSKEPLYNPQLVFGHLDNITSGSTPPSFIDEANAVHTATVLSIVSETGPVTISDLIGMLSSRTGASILYELSFVEVLQEQETRSKNVTLSLLYYLGIVTFHKDPCSQKGRHSLCAPNSTMVHLVSPGISCLGECC